jgi:hypothetical protein
MKRGILIALLLSLIPGNSYASTSSQLQALPIKSITPGAIDSRVNQSNIASTICIVGYTKTVRPPASFTNALKISQLRGSYSRYGSTNVKLFEEDHLIPLALGGAPRDPKNLWPEPWESARKKDTLELKLHLMVCAGQISLAKARSIFATDWTKGYATYVGSN